MRKTLLVLGTACLIAAMLQGCGSTDSSKETVASTAQALMSPGASATAAPAAASTAPKKDIQLDTVTLKNDSGKTMLKSITTKKTGHSDHASVALVSSKGTVAIADPNAMPHEKGLLKADIITVSHKHTDHTDPDFLKPYFQKEVEAKLSYMIPEEFTVKDIHVKGIAAGHESKWDPLAPSDILYVYEVDGWRIAHLGDYAQDEFTQEQLEQLGHLDVVFMDFSSKSQYGFTTAKYIKAIQQLKPSIVLPLHYEQASIDEILKATNITDKSETDTLLLDPQEFKAIKGTKFIMLK